MPDCLVERKRCDRSHSQTPAVAARTQEKNEVGESLGRVAVAVDHGAVRHEYTLFPPDIALIPPNRIPPLEPHFLLVTTRLSIHFHSYYRSHQKS